MKELMDQEISPIIVAPIVLSFVNEDVEGRIIDYGKCPSPPVFLSSLVICLVESRLPAFLKMLRKLLLYGLCSFPNSARILLRK
jgi:hypothetical protein